MEPLHRSKTDFGNDFGDDLFSFTRQLIFAATYRRISGRLSRSLCNHQKGVCHMRYFDTSLEVRTATGRSECELYQFDSGFIRDSIRELSRAAMGESTRVYERPGSMDTTFIL